LNQAAAKGFSEHNSDIAYHLRELETVRNPESPFHVMPEFSQNDQVILDIGCGIGQTLVTFVFEHDKLLVGLDIDLDSLSFGHRQFHHIKFVNATAECLPFQDNSFDFVISRVSLPYTNIPQSLAEIARVLKNNGRVWLTMHPFSMVIKHLGRSIRNCKIKDVFYRSYVIANGVFFHLFSRLLQFPVNKKYESFQTESRIKQCIKNVGFVEVYVQKGKHFICTARKASPALLPASP
jgi:ubiquinone/menaquinone biosynthesis C-methylase UbiE